MTEFTFFDPKAEPPVAELAKTPTGAKFQGAALESPFIYDEDRIANLEARLDALEKQTGLVRKPLEIRPSSGFKVPV